MSTLKASGGGVTIHYPMLAGDNYGVEDDGAVE